MFKKQPLPSRGSLQLSGFSFFLVTAVASSADTAQPFLGAIPVQFVAPGQELVLDMHRFFHPGATAKLEFTLPAQTGALITKMRGDGLPSGRRREGAPTP